MSDIQDKSPGTGFIREIIQEDIKNGKHAGRVHTRFPPEPNGYLHIGHAKSICLNFGVAEEFSGLCNLRFDDTNPLKENTEYVDSIIEDIKWLGFDYGDRQYFASDYFEQLYQYAVDLIRRGKAYVCSLSADQIREYRGTLTEPGKNSPDRERSVEENLDLFARMRAGDFEDGKYTLRAKIDMASGNLNMRDPALYRIRKVHHHRQGGSWCIYPMYDFAHCLSDSIEGITHSLCTLEFEDHRPLYDWILDELELESHPQQIEFARLSLTNTVLSKRKLLRLVEEKHVTGWDDPRMPTLAAMRRRGYTPAAIRDLCEKIGVAKANSRVDVSLLDFCQREDLNKRANRVMAVLNPLRVVITNYPEGQVEQLVAENNPEDSQAGEREIPFSRVLYVERDDFKEDAPKKWFRLAPGKEVRLKHAFYITCTEIVKDEQGELVELRCTYDPETKGGWSEDGRKVKGTLHWVSAEQAIEAEVRLYEHLFISENPDQLDEEQDFVSLINPQAMTILKGCKLEPGLAQAVAGLPYQFLRLGYFCLDSKDSRADNLVFNRTLGLRDTWAKIEKNSNSK